MEGGLVGGRVSRPRFLVGGFAPERTTALDAYTCGAYGESGRKMDLWPFQAAARSGSLAMTTRLRPSRLAW